MSPLVQFTRLQARVVDGAYLWNLRMGNNVGHALAEDVLSLHNSLCKHSGTQITPIANDPD